VQKNELFLAYSCRKYLRQLTKS